MRWTIVHTPTKHGDGHKIYRDEKGRFALADWSGGNPDQTDDGPLYVHKHATVRISLKDGLRLHLALVDCRGKPCGTYTDLEALASLNKHGLSLHMTGTPEFHALLNLLNDGFGRVVLSPEETHLR